MNRLPVLIAIVLALLLVWWLYSLFERSELVAEDTVEVVAIEGVPSTITVPTTTTTTAPPTTTTAVARTAPTVRTASVSRPRPTDMVGVQCGGDLPPCWVLKRESGGDPRIWNGRCYMPTGSYGQCGRSSASGLWQFLRSTWAGFGGYVNAADAPVEVQNEKARQVWAGGRGCSHWAAC